jgi:hypothetical protein
MIIADIMYVLNVIESRDAQMKFKIEIVGNDIYIPITKYSTFVMDRGEVQDLINDILNAIDNDNSNQEIRNHQQ